MLCFRVAAAVGLAVAAASLASVAAAADAAPQYDLTPRVMPGDMADMAITLEAGGELLVPDAQGVESKIPLSVVAKLAFAEQIVAWSPDAAEPVRSLRRYAAARADIKTDDSGVARTLPDDRRVLVAELAAAGFAVHGLDGPLTRDQYDLVAVVGNTLALDRLLPGKALGEGDGWDHDAETIGALLGMDHVAICEVRSVVTGADNRQVQIRMAGTVHGTIDGAATEMELRAAYLFHLDRARVSKFNLAVKERRKPGEVSPGLDVVAKTSIVAAPATAAAPAFDDATLARAAAMSPAELRELLVDAPPRGYRFRHDLSWFVTAEQRELMSLRLIDEGQFLAHCNVATTPPGPIGKEITLQEFEREVVGALGGKVGKVSAATEWTTPAGHRCLGVFVDGTVNDVEVQWRYYRIAAAGLPQTTVSVTVEQAALERFANADRPLVDSLELVPPAAQTAAASADAETK